MGPKTGQMFSNLRGPRRELNHSRALARTNQTSFSVFPVKSCGLEQNLRSMKNHPQADLFNKNCFSNSHQQQDARPKTYQARTHHSSDLTYMQSKRSRAEESYFRDSKFTGVPEQFIGNLIREFMIRAVQECFDKSQWSLFFVTALAVKSMNDSLESDGIVPSALVFVEFTSTGI